MNKKSIATLLSIVMTIGLVSACNGQEANVVDNPGSDGSETIDYEITATPDIEGYNLLWSDEFDGNKLNENIWTMEVREAGWTNNELQSYEASTDNIFVKDGNLVLKAIKNVDENGNVTYTSGKVNSQNKADFTYGKVVVRAKAPEGQGLWPAAWMMPTDESFYGQWPKCGEIDIMEVLGNDPITAYTTIHYGEPHGSQQGIHTLSYGSFCDSYHLYSVEWEPGEMRFFVDGNPTLTCNDWFSAEGDNEKPYPAPFNQSFFVQMNLAVGGNWPGNPDETTDFDNAEFLIDYVRVYQKSEYDMNVSKPTYDMKEPTEDGNCLYNGDFSVAEDLGDDVDWKFLLTQGGAGAAEIKDNMIEITSTNAGTVDYSVQLVNWDIPFEKGKKYRVSFDARADETRDIISCITAPYVDWIRYYPDTHFEVGPEWQTITYEFDMTDKTDPRGRFEVNLGNCGSTATVDIKNVRIEVVE